MPAKKSRSAKKAPSKKSKTPQSIVIRGVRQNNLKGIDLDLPLGKLNVVTGPSGSGKSSLAFDTIYAEGQRRYVETFSPYTRQFLDRMDKPDADEIHGIPPAIAIQQSNSVKTSRSTVGTMTEINDYLKLLFPKVASGFCPECAQQIRPDSPKAIIDRAIKALKGESALITFGVPVPPGTKPKEFFEFLQQQGYLRIWLKDKVVRTDEAKGTRRLPGLVHVIQDRIEISAKNRPRIQEAVESSLGFGKGMMRFIRLEDGEQFAFSTGWHCADCDLDIRPPTPALFSFNNPLGACPDCRGFGRVIGIDLERATPNKRISIRGGVVKPFQSDSGKQCQRDLMQACDREQIDVDCPFADLPEVDQKFVLFGSGYLVDTEAETLHQNGEWYGVKGFFDWLEGKTYKMHVRVFLSRYRSYTKCPTCDGGRYQPETLNYKIPDADGNWLTLPDVNIMAASDAVRVIADKSILGDNDNPATTMMQREVVARLSYLVEVGLGYLSLDRATRTLSGGEIERVNLTSCLGASLVNSLFVMDEPSIGLHPRDIGRLIEVMKSLRDKGNTLLVVEHEEAVIRAADNLVDIGPGRGESGGELVFHGPINKLKAAKNSLTSDYIYGRKYIPIPEKRRTSSQHIEVIEASANNLRDITVKFPIGVMTCVTGVSGSGKSTLVESVLTLNLMRMLGKSIDEEPGKCASVHGLEHIDEIVLVDQSPLSKTPRSTPAVYVGAFEHVRKMFAELPESKTLELTPGTFSFNSGDGRCERCGGNGFERVEMQFLSDLYLRCPDCEGKRYRPHILKIKMEGKTIDDILQMTVTSAIAFFKKLGKEGRAVAKPLAVLEDVGLGYLRMGQPLNTLSGGESQRCKLVGHLVEKRKESTVLVFDEPTTGLHFDDIALLVKVFDRLVEQGNTVIVIEHNMDVIKRADHVIDIGPEAGDGGGHVVVEGTPEKIVKAKDSWTGRYLKPVLAVKPGEVPKEPKAYKNNDSALPLAAEQVAAYRGNPDNIEVHGAREHNLKNISVSIPRDELVIVTGLSGSGKSTLAFDILFSEGQRRFLDSMSPYARQFVEQLEKPDVDLINGLPPTVAIEQRITRGGGKSTVATVTEVYHFLRLMFSKLGVQHCPDCHVPVEKQSAKRIALHVEELAEKGKVRILAPLVKAKKGFHTDIAKWAEKKGFETLLVDRELTPVKGFQKLERFKEHTIDVVIGSITAEDSKGLDNMVVKALDIGKGTARVLDHRNRIHVLSSEMTCPDCGLAFEELDPRLFSFNSQHGWCTTCRGFGQVFKAHQPKIDNADSIIEGELQEEKVHESAQEEEVQTCPDCEGTRLNSIARHVHVGKYTINDFANASISNTMELLDDLGFEPSRKAIADSILPEIHQRLHFMEKVGLSYLALGRSAKTLSGGESQRIRLAAQLGSNLRGVLYVLDEPTIGLHPRDNLALLDTLQLLKDKGNSLIVVEHDEETMRRADRIIDLGPRAGIHGGEIVAEGTPEEIRKNKKSATGEGLSGKGWHALRDERRPTEDLEEWLELTGATANNLKNVDVKFPIGRLVVISGISGSGKSSLMRGTLMPALTEAVASTRRRSAKPKANREWKEILGVEHIDKAYEVDQTPIGKTSRSTPATYIKVLDDIRKLFAQTPVARMRGYTASRFSFNNEGGRCETCGGQGVIKLEMSFLPTSFVPCDDCNGMRYNPQTLEATYNEKNIGDVMDMTIEQAAEFFASNPKIHRPLALLDETGLGYLKLGQPSPTLSGGEAQRLKLVTQLKRGVGRAADAKLRKNKALKSTVYLLEEPTIGLHMSDVKQLLSVLHRLVDEGNTVIVIEHNVSVIAEADYVIDIGPEAGENGGLVVAKGTPEEVATSKESRIAPFLREVFDA